MAAFCAACGEGGTPVVSTPLTHDPVLFIHGWNENAAVWAPMQARFRSAGWSDGELHTMSYVTSQSNISIADEVRARVTQVLLQTGAARVDIVSHSMGALSSRYYIKFLGGDSKVDAWVSLAGPNHGSSLAIFCSEDACLDMRPSSAFLANLNAGDETPGAVRYGTWWSACDEAIDPRESATVTGATNTQTAGCISHLAFLDDVTVFAQVRAFIAP